MRLYGTIQEYADECGFSIATAKRRAKEGILQKVSAVKGGGRIAGYVDIYEANLHFANTIMGLHVNSVKEPMSTFGKAILQDTK